MPHVLLVLMLPLVARGLCADRLIVRLVPYGFRLIPALVVTITRSQFANRLGMVLFKAIGEIQE